MAKKSRLKTIAVMSRNPERVQIEINAMPGFEVDRMCSTLISCANRFFQNPTIQADFESWKRNRQEATQ